MNSRAFQNQKMPLVTQRAQAQAMPFEGNWCKSNVQGQDVPFHYVRNSVDEHKSEIQFLFLQANQLSLLQKVKKSNVTSNKSFEQMR